MSLSKAIEEARSILKSGDTYSPPAGARTAARRALNWIADGKAGSGFTDVGRKRASDLANGHSVSFDTVKRIKAYFDRHQVDKNAEGFSAGEEGYPSPGRVAWDAWGGDAAWSWAKSIVERAEAKKVLKYSPDQERGSDGRWETDQFGNVPLQNIPEVAPHYAGEQALAESLNRGIAEKLVPVSKDPIEVPTKLLSFGQGWVDGKKVGKMTKSTSAFPPISVVAKDGKYYVVNGTHRGVSAILRGDETIKAIEHAYVPKKSAKLLKYSPDQERASNGEFGSGTTNAATQGVEFPRTFAVQTEHQGPTLDPSSLTAFHEQNALRIYVKDEGTEKINGALREGRVTPGEAPSTPQPDIGDAIKYTKAERPQSDPRNNTVTQSINDQNVGLVIKSMDNAIAREKLTQDTVMFRGISTTREFKIGDRFTDKGYTSCSKNLVDARTFARGRSGLPTNLTMKTYGGSPRVFEILVPKGTNVLSGAQNIGETILPRGTTFEVVGIRKDAKGAKDIGGVIQLRIVK